MDISGYLEQLEFMYIANNKWKIYTIAKTKVYDVNEYIKMRNKHIGITVKLPRSKKHAEGSYFIENVTSIPRNIQQRIADSNGTSYSNMIDIFNKYTDQKIEPVTVLEVMIQQGMDIKIIQKIVDEIDTRIKN